MGFLGSLDLATSKADTIAISLHVSLHIGVAKSRPAAKYQPCCSMLDVSILLLKSVMLPQIATTDLCSDYDLFTFDTK